MKSGARSSALVARENVAGFTWKSRMVPCTGVNGVEPDEGGLYVFYSDFSPGNLLLSDSLPAIAVAPLCDTEEVLATGFAKTTVCIS